MTKLSLKNARILADMTQVDMANALDLSESTYVRYESYRNFMRMDTAFKFAELVGRKLDEIIFLPNNYRNTVVSKKEEKTEA